MPEHASSSEENVCLIKDKIGFKLHLSDVCVVVTVGHYSFVTVGRDNNLSSEMSDAVKSTWGHLGELREEGGKLLGLSV